MPAIAPNLTYLTYQDGPRNTNTHWVTDSPELADTFSWFIPSRRGEHDLKLGFQFYYVQWRYTNAGTMNGLFTIPSNAGFNPADPRTYPERLQIRVPSDLEVLLHQRAYTGFAQDKWRLSNRLTLNLGLRYDIDFTPLAEPDNPLFPDPSRYPVDKNNVSPRMGFTYSTDGGRGLVRAGWGRFYDKLNFTTVLNYVGNGVYTPSALVNFPADNIDPGPRAGRLPTDPMLSGGPFVNRALLNNSFPPGTATKNTGDVYLDTPERVMPNTQTLSAGYQRQLGARLSISGDYVHTIGRELFIARNLNPGVRVNTTASGAIVRVPDAVLNGQTFVTNVYDRINAGSYDYDALNVILDKRDSNNWSGRISYTLAYSRGNTPGGQAAVDQFQYLDNLNLDLNQGPTDYDRRHNLVFSGRGQIPGTYGLTVSGTLRLLSGTPFTLMDTSSDPDRNGQLFDPLPAGTYSGTGANAISVENKSGRNGAYGPGFAQLDLRVGWRFRPGGGRTLDLTADVINVTDRANFVNPAGDRRSTNFLLLTALYGGGQPRQAQVGLRFGF